MTQAGLTSGPSSLSTGRGITGIAIMTVIAAVVLFATAGTVRWWGGWAYLVAMTVAMAVYAVVMLKCHPDLIEERRHPPPDAKSWDKPFVALIGVVGPTALILLTGLDHRFGWSRSIGLETQLFGLLVLVAGFSLTNWAVISNRVFSAVVRIQRDRGHQVVHSGPYRFVRHPGYLGSILHMLGASLLLGSWVGLGLSLLLTLVLAVRTAMEDATLQAELEGYRDYARRVRFRLFPGVW